MQDPKFAHLSDDELEHALCVVSLGMLSVIVMSGLLIWGLVQHVM